jgi:hypothetical protein
MIRYTAVVRVRSVSKQNVPDRYWPARKLTTSTGRFGSRAINPGRLFLTGQHPPFAIGSRLSAKRPFADPKKTPASSRSPFFRAALGGLGMYVRWGKTATSIEFRRP